MQHKNLQMSNLNHTTPREKVQTHNRNQKKKEFKAQEFCVNILSEIRLQIFKGVNHFQTNNASQIAAMAYLDLILRSVTEPALLKIFVQFLLDETKFDGDRILDVLVERLLSNDNRVSENVNKKNYRQRKISMLVKIWKIE